VEKKVKCWERFECEESECPALRSDALKCWLVPGTLCRGEIEGSFLSKMEMCLQCEALKANLDAVSWEHTLRVVCERFQAVSRIVEERDQELEDISMELALGLSEVFDALNRISSGDTQVRIPETSELELVAQLKRIVNLTAANLSEIIDLSHDFAIGLAEHFGVLDRVTKGDLEARVTGDSDVELLEALKRMVNQTIESVSIEISDRKRAEEALKKARDELEIRVRERTTELRAANELLKQEIAERKRVEDALRESQAHYHSVVEDQTELICRFTPDGRLTFVNRAYCRYFDKKAEDLIGRKLITDILDDMDQDLLSSLSSMGSENLMVTREYRVVVRDGEIRWQQWNIRAICDEQGRTVEFQGVGRDVTARKRAEERLLTYHKRLRSLASTLSLAEQQERRRIATEVHDHIGQNLAFTKIKLGTLTASTTSAKLKKEVDDVVKLVDEAIQDTRSLVSELGSPILYELGLVPAVEWLTQQTHRRYGIVMDFKDDGRVKPLSDDVRVLLFQAVRELLANVVRHARARTAEVVIVRSGDQIRVEVKDDGIGFDPADIGPGVDQSTRFGLFSIRERLEPLGGRVEVASKPGQGTRVTLSGPLQPDVESNTIKIS